MRRLLVLLIALVGAWGCKSDSPPRVDPFFGRTRIPPPGTGAVSGQSGDSYYVPPPNAGTAAPGCIESAPSDATPIQGLGPPPSTAPSAAPSGGSVAPSGATPPVSNPGTFPYRGTAAPAAASPRPYRPATTVAPPSFVDRSKSGQAPAAETANAKSPTFVASKTAPATDRKPVIQILQPRPQEAEEIRRRRQPRSLASSSSREPARFLPVDEPIDIMDLPKAKTSDSRTGSTGDPSAEGFRLVSATSADDNGTEVVAAAGGEPLDSAAPATFSTPSGRYGYAGDYRWIRGRLDYSQMDRCWKLRYIPVDGAADEYGGSVVLSEAPALAGLERGDYVELRGRIHPPDGRRNQVATYEVESARRID